MSKKKLILGIISIIILLAIAITTYFFVIGQSLYSLYGIKKDNVVRITISKVGVYDYETQTGDSISKDVYINGDDKEAFSELNEEISKTRIRKTLFSKMDLPDKEHYRVTVFTNKPLDENTLTYSVDHPETMIFKTHKDARDNPNYKMNPNYDFGIFGKPQLDKLLTE